MPKHPKDTAIRRTGPSAPLRYLIASGEFWRDASWSSFGLNGPTILDYGCGHGADVEHLRSLGYDADGWDPYWQPRRPAQRYDIVLCTYVLNVITCDAERAEALRQVQEWTKPGGVAFVTVRRDLDADTESQRRIFLDFPSIVAGTGFETYRIETAS